jgi:cytochrome c oxidase subunit 2
MHSKHPLVHLGALIALAATLWTGCGTSSAHPAVPLSPAAERGLDVVLANGCFSCHGDSGRGGIGPGWVGLYDAPVTLTDGSTVTADDAYLTRAITDPGADKVRGFNVGMPPNRLSASQVAEVVAYIKALASAG